MSLNLWFTASGLDSGGLDDAAHGLGRRGHRTHGRARSANLQVGRPESAIWHRPDVLAGAGGRAGADFRSAFRVGFGDTRAIVWRHDAKGEYIGELRRPLIRQNPIRRRSPSFASATDQAVGVHIAICGSISLVAYLPWFWLCGSLLTLVMLATGMIGVEQLRRSSRLVESGDLPRRCRALADSLGMARRVSVGICDRVAMPVLIGIVRPLILLPPAALSGWSVEQLEMVLLHELAHLRRWDNLVNLLQRFVESLLFFHPVVWWLSGWVRLERELCCDRLVVERLGQPVAYAEMLVALSGSTSRGHRR